MLRMAAEPEKAPGDCDGYEAGQVEEAIRESLNEVRLLRCCLWRPWRRLDVAWQSTSDCVYAVGGVHQERRGRGKGRIRGQLSILNEVL